jgi:hypothetical protein
MRAEEAQASPADQQRAGRKVDVVSFILCVREEESVVGVVVLMTEFPWSYKHLIVQRLEAEAGMAWLRAATFDVPSPSRRHLSRCCYLQTFTPRIPTKTNTCDLHDLHDMR